MMDCKRALTEADGDYDKAVEILRVSGQAKRPSAAQTVCTNGLVASIDGALLQLGLRRTLSPRTSRSRRLRPMP